MGVAFPCQLLLYKPKTNISAVAYLVWFSSPWLWPHLMLNHNCYVQRPSAPVYFVSWGPTVTDTLHCTLICPLLLSCKSPTSSTTARILKNDKKNNANSLCRVCCFFLPLQDLWLPWPVTYCDLWPPMACDLPWPIMTYDPDIPWPVTYHDLQPTMTYDLPWPVTYDLLWPVTYRDPWPTMTWDWTMTLFWYRTLDFRSVKPMKCNCISHTLVPVAGSTWLILPYHLAHSTFSHIYCPIFRWIRTLSFATPTSMDELIL